MNEKAGRIIFKAVLMMLLLIFSPEALSPGVPQNMEEEPNNSGSEAGVISPGTPIRGFYQTSGDQDWFRLKIEQPPKGLYDIRVQAVPGVDAALEIYDNQGRQLKRINSGPAGGPERIPNMGLKPGEYFLVVRGDEMNAETAYVLSLRLVEPWTEDLEFEPNDNTDFANPLDRGKPLTASLEPAGDEDWYFFKQSAEEHLLCEIDGVPGIDLYLDLHRASGERAARIDYGKEGQGELLSLPRGDPGQYFLKVGSFGRAEVPRYRLSLRQADYSDVDRNAIKAALARALGFLEKTQKEDGTWEGRNGDRSGTIGLALLAFLEKGDGMGGGYRKSIERCLKGLKEKYRPSSDFPEGSREWAHYGGLLDTVEIMYSHSIGLIALMKAMDKTKDESLRPMIEDGLDVLIRSQNVERKPAHLGGPVEKGSPHYGGWRFSPGNLDSDISVTAWVVSAIHEAIEAGFRIPERTIPDAAFFVKSCFIDKEHGFSFLAGAKKPGCARTASGVLALQLMDRSNDPLVEAGCLFILRHPPIWNMEQIGGGFPFYYWHHATRVMAIRGGSDWNFWKKQVGDMLVSHQNEDGSWTAAQKEGYYTPAYAAAFGALILEFICNEEGTAQ